MKSSRLPKPPALGFSLLELMVSVTVAAILLAIAVPNFRTFIQRSALTSRTNGLIGDLQQARSEAATRRSFVSLCARTSGDTGTTCISDDASKAWDYGWLVYAATTANALYKGTAADDPDILGIQQPVPNISIRSTEQLVTFSQRGDVVGGADIIFKLCAGTTGAGAVGTSTGEVPGKQVTLGSGGHVSTADLAAGDSCI